MEANNANGSWAGSAQGHVSDSPPGESEPGEEVTEKQARGAKSKGKRRKRVSIESERGNGEYSGATSPSAQPPDFQLTGDPKEDELIEKKRKKWICLLRNRESAARDRQRKKEYLKDLETKVQTLEKENAQLRARVSDLERTHPDYGGAGANGGAGLTRQNSRAAKRSRAT